MRIHSASLRACKSSSVLVGSGVWGLGFFWLAVSVGFRVQGSGSDMRVYRVKISGVG